MLGDNFSLICGIRNFWTSHIFSLNDHYIARGSTTTKEQTGEDETLRSVPADAPNLVISMGLLHSYP
jgi:hypothetical protein